MRIKVYQSFILIFLSSFIGYAQDFEFLKKYSSQNPDSAIIVLNEFTSHESDSVKAVAYQLMGNCYYFKTEYDSAIDNYLKSNDRLDSTKAEQLALIGNNYNNLGVCENFLQRLNHSYEYHRKSLRIRKSLDDPRVTSSLNNIGLILHDLGEYEKALNYYEMAFDEKVKRKQSSKLSTTIRNIARVYTDLNKYDSALNFLERNLIHLDTVPDNRELAFTYNAMGNVYYNLQQYDQALIYSREAFNRQKELRNYTGLINNALNLSLYSRSLGNVALAEAYLDSLDRLVPNIDVYSDVPRYYKYRSIDHELLGESAKALEYLKISNHKQDSINSATNTQQLLDLEEKYQSEVKEAQISKLTAENQINELQAKQDKQTKLILAVVALALIIIAASFYSRFKNKSKTNALLDAKNQELAAINRTKDRLFSIISHDLKSPLSSFHIITKSLADNLDNLDKAQLREYLISLRDSSANVRDMMDNLLKWALSQTNQLSMRQEAVEVNPILSDVMSQLQLVSEAKGVTMDMKMEYGAIALGDASFIEIVIRNILSNSLKFTPSGKSVSIFTEAKSDKTIFRVVDRGVGMDQVDADRLLKGEIVGQEIMNSSEKGTGLGITLVRELVDKMGGAVDIKTAKGKGTTFTVLFEKAA